MNGRLISIALVFILLLMSLPFVNGKFNDFDENQVFYNLGLRIGDSYNFKVELLNSFFKYDNNLNVEKQIIFLKDNYPLFYHELKGLSDATNIELERLVNIQNYLYGKYRGMCTNTISTGSATKYDETFLTQNLDVEINRLFDLLTVIVLRLFSKNYCLKNTDYIGYRYAFWGIPILFEIPVINEKGLAIGGTSIFISDLDKVKDDLEGIPPIFLERLIMLSCGNVSEVADLLESVKLTSTVNGKKPTIYHSFSFCDQEGGILSVEYTQNNLSCVFGNNVIGYPNVLWHTNHHIWLDSSITGSIISGESNQANSSFYRAARASEILLDNYGEIDRDLCKDIICDHKGGSKNDRRDSYDICCHPDRNYKGLTVFSWITNSKNLTVYWTVRSPCKSRFKEENFSSVFNTED